MQWHQTPRMPKNVRIHDRKSWFSQVRVDMRTTTAHCQPSNYNPDNKINIQITQRASWWCISARSSISSFSSPGIPSLCAQSPLLDFFLCCNFNLNPPSIMFHFFFVFLPSSSSRQQHQRVLELSGVAGTNLSLYICLSRSCLVWNFFFFCWCCSRGGASSAVKAEQVEEEKS